MRSNLGSRIDDIDVQMERVARLIDSGAQIDRELAAGLGCNASMTSVQNRIDGALAECETLQKAIRQAPKK